MKLKSDILTPRTASAIVITMLSLVMASTAQAQAKVNLNGSLLVGTCSVTAGSNNQTVDLGNYQASQFNAVGDVSSWKQFDIVLENCSSLVTKIDFGFGGTKEGTNYYKIDNAGTAGVAKGLAIHLTRNAWASSTYVPPGTTDSWDKRSDNTYAYAARYVRVGDLAAGTANASITITLAYR